jgi:predicted amidohydrolase
MSTFSISRGSFTQRAGVVICYDLRFPELVRAMALRGMDVLFVPARWPSARDDAWYTLLKARAIENQIFVVGCNALGKEGGYSYSFDPLGRCIFSNKTATQRHFATFLLDMTTIAHARSFHQNLKEAVLL